MFWLHQTLNDEFENDEQNNQNYKECVGMINLSRFQILKNGLNGVEDELNACFLETDEEIG